MLLKSISFIIVVCENVFVLFCLLSCRSFSTCFIQTSPPSMPCVLSRSAANREKLQEHILTNRATSFLLDNMLNATHRNPKYYPEDIYEPYHKRTGVPWDYKLRKPKFFPWTGVVSYLVFVCAYKTTTVWLLLFFILSLSPYYSIDVSS